MTLRKIAIIGGGSLGTALAINLSKKLAVTLVLRSPEHAEQVASSRLNAHYVTGVVIPENVKISADLPNSILEADLVFIATPVSAFTSVLRQVVEAGKNAPVLWGCKGFHPGNGEPLSQTVEEILGSGACYGVLSGPSFAEGLAANDPSALVVATNADRKTTLAIAAALSNDTLRVYANADLIGVQICGAIKNIYAIASGVIDGCGWGVNTRAAMMTRAVAEAKRYLKHHHAKQSTLMGLSGFGDLFLTCGSRISRNYQVGMGLASGTPLATVLENLGHVAEGVNTTRLIHRRAVALGVDMPIVAAVAEVLDGSKNPRECVAALMARDITDEQRGRKAARKPPPTS